MSKSSCLLQIHGQKPKWKEATQHLCLCEDSILTAWRWSEGESRSAVSDSLQPHSLYGPWNSPDKNTWVGRHFLLQRTFLTQGSNPDLLHCMKILYQVLLVIKNPPANAEHKRDAGLIPESRRSPGRGHGNQFEYSCLENLMDRGASGTTVHGVANSRTWLKWLSMHA